MRFWKFTAAALVGVVTAALVSTSAYAAQNVANTAQKGSLLVFPAIDVTQGATTTIRISNDSNFFVSVKCYYVNETKFRNDFLFRLTPRQAIVFDAATGAADPFGSLQEFPTAVSNAFPTGNPFRGELICFAVNGAGSAQISHNHLSGTATVAANGGSYEYNSWNFAARGVARGDRIGTPGQLDLTGQAGAYDACPAYNIIHFTPTGAPGAPVPMPAQGNNRRVSVSSCLQDLRQDFVRHFTKLQMNFWNSNEVKFTGAWECANSTESFLLSEIDVLPQNASFGVLGTQAAHVQIRGVASTQCNPPVSPVVTENTGILAVSAEVAVIAGEVVLEVPLHGTTANHAGVSPVVGFVMWDTQEDEAPEAPRR
jgi:hypothetical protein